MSKGLSPAVFFLAVMFYFILLFGISIWGSGHEGNIDVSGQNLLIMKIMQAVAGAFIFMLIPALITLVSTEKLHHFLLHKAPSFFFVLISCVLIIAAVPLISYLEELNKHMSLPSAFSGIEHWMKVNEEKIGALEEAFMKEKSVGDLLMNVFVIAFMAAMGEEFFFRGLIQRSMMNATNNVHLAVWCTAILFSAFHLQFFGFFPRVLLGAILGYIFVWSGSLWTSVIVHFLNNGLILVFAYMINTDVLPKSVEQIGVDDGNVSLAWVFPSVVLVGGCMYILYKMRKPVQLIS